MKHISEMNIIERNNYKMLSLSKKCICFLLAVIITLVFGISGCSEPSKSNIEFEKVNTFSPLNRYGSYSKQGDWLLYSKSDYLMIYSLETGESYTLLKDKFNLLESGYGYKTIVGNKIYYITSSWMNTPGNMYQYDIDTGEKVKIPGIDATIYTYMATNDYLYIILYNSTMYRTSELYRYDVADRKSELVAEGNYCYACFSKDNMYFYDSIADSLCKMSLLDFKVETLYNNNGTYAIGSVRYDNMSLYFCDRYDVMKYDIMSNELSKIYDSDDNDINSLTFWVYGNYLVYDIDYKNDFQEIKVLNLLTNETIAIVKSYNDYLYTDVFEDTIIVHPQEKTEIYSFSGELLATLP